MRSVWTNSWFRSIVNTRNVWWGLSLLTCWSFDGITTWNRNSDESDGHRSKSKQSFMVQDCSSLWQFFQLLENDFIAPLVRWYHQIGSRSIEGEERKQNLEATNSGWKAAVWVRYQPRSSIARLANAARTSCEVSKRGSPISSFSQSDALFNWSISLRDSFVRSRN